MTCNMTLYSVSIKMRYLMLLKKVTLSPPLLFSSRTFCIYIMYGQIVISLEKHASLTTDPSAALQETFVKTNTALMVTPMNYMTSGCTCVAVYMKGRTLYVANSGDSRAVMAVDDGESYRW